MPSSFTSLAREIEESEHWLSPSELLAQLEIVPGMTVAEVGAGTGSYALPISRRIDNTGQVFAIEWRTWMLEKLQSRVLSAAPANLQVVVGRAADMHLPDHCCDLVVYADIWHELEHHAAVLDEAERVLRPNGRIAILNWRPNGYCPPGPPLEHRTSMRATICTVEMKSWSLIKVVDEAPDGYLIVFEKTDESVQS